MKKIFGLFVLSAVLMVASTAPALAEAAAAAGSSGGSGNTYFTVIAISSAFAMALAAGVVSIGQSNAIRSALEGIARNPGAAGKILSTLLIGLAMMESLAIYVLVIALILLFANPFLSYM